MRGVYCVLLLLFLLGCTQLDIETTTQIEILYEHTVLMEQISTPEQLDAIGLDTAFLSGTEDPKLMIEELDKAFDVKTEGTYEHRILELEDVMNEMMELWYNETQNI